MFVFLSHLLNCERSRYATFITNFTRSVGRDGLVKISDLSDNPQSLLRISSGLFLDFCVYSYLLNIGRFWHATIQHFSQGFLEEMDHLSRRPVNDIRIVHGLQMTQKIFRVRVVVNSRSNL